MCFESRPTAKVAGPPHLTVLSYLQPSSSKRRYIKTPLGHHFFLSHLFRPWTCRAASCPWAEFNSDHFLFREAQSSLKVKVSRGERDQRQIDLPTALCGLAQKLKRSGVWWNMCVLPRTTEIRLHLVPWSSTTWGHRASASSLLETPAGLQAPQTVREA